MRDINRYVVRKYSDAWYDIGIELGLELNVLDAIEKDNSQQHVTCFRKTLDKWLQLNTDDATWRTLEVALTNVNRAKLELDPVDDVYGEDDTFLEVVSHWTIAIMYRHHVQPKVWSFVMSCFTHVQLELGDTMILSFIVILKCHDNRN